MIQVSSEFKKAIKQPERKIKGYVEVLYDLPSVEVGVNTNIGRPGFISLDEMVDGNRVENLYGSLDYLPLDGSQLVIDENNVEDIGFISYDLFEDLTTPTFNLLFNSTTIKGITMYFRTNTPTNLAINYSDGTSDTITNNESNVIQVIFNEPKTLTSIEIIINNVEYPDRKLYINEIDLGITQVYKDQDLIDFTIDEEVNKLVEEAPINETNINLNNMSDLFNPLNPTGIVPYLSENTLIKPYIGVLTENLGIEYVKMGEFYFDSYTNNSDATTTLVGKNLLKLIEKEPIKCDNEKSIFYTSLSESNFDDFMQNYNYTYTKSWTKNIGPLWWKENSLMKFLSDMAFWQENLFYIDRQNTITIKSLDYNIKDTLSKTELINDVEFKYIEKINTLKISKNTYGSETVSSREILKETVALEKSPQIFLITSSSPEMMFATVSQSGGTSASIISAGFYMAFVKVSGTEGSNVELTFTTTKQSNSSKTEFLKTNKGNNNEKAITFDNEITYIMGQDKVDAFTLLDRTPSYEMRFDYNGDPSLEAGDYINVETPYGYKKLFIQKNRFKFDGGLEGSIEGVE